MTNIWEFLIQTLSVTLVAGVLLLLKYVLNDKLSPRWQYGIWSVLVIRMLIPVPVGRKLLFPFAVWVEMIKGLVENMLTSSYSGKYVPVKLEYCFPMVQGKPTSITDWLFVIYVAGIVVSLVWYLISYVRLRALLRKGTVPPVKLQYKIKNVCEKYRLKNCKSICIEGLPSAFVCSGLSPVLALPAGVDVDEKIILHELLHLKYHDELQNIGWCILRSLHWCNPVIQFVMNHIENDMESLCDQRVLERLEGEERRDYGRMLLAMANEKYARTPGTSSISNGGKNIAKRIKAIVRFKKYPKGMALVSVCIVIVVMVPMIRGYAYDSSEANYNVYRENEIDYSMAMVRVNRCTTVAGAIDTYAKGLITKNGFYVATASPISKHEQIEREMRMNARDGWRASYLDPGKSFQYLVTPDNYRIYNLEEVTEDKYKAYLAFNVSGFKTDDGEYCTVEEGACLIIPIEVRYEDAWVVEECGERIEALHSIENATYPEGAMPFVKEYIAKGETGEVIIGVRTYYYVNNEGAYTNSFFGNMASFDETLKVDAEFEMGYQWNFAEYTYKEDANGNLPKSTFGIQYVGIHSENEKVDFSDVEMNGCSGGGNNWGESWQSDSVSGNRDRTLSSGGGGSISENFLESAYPSAYKLRIYWDNEVVEELTAVETHDVEFLKKEVITVENANGQTSGYMDAELKKEFKAEKDASYKATREVSKEEVDKIIEEFAFAEYEEQKSMHDDMAALGVYYFSETHDSRYYTIYIDSIHLMEPMVFYNANDESWIVVCAGYCYDGSWDDKAPGDVGTRDRFGIEYRNLTGEDDMCVISARAFLANENGSKKVETTNRGDSLYYGFAFELQDYTYRDKAFVSELGFVGYRWYGACTYDKGYEDMGGDLIVRYNHTK